MTMNRADLICTVCQRHRMTLRPRKSKLKPNMQMFLCNECFEERREPKYLVIMVARKKKKPGDDSPAGLEAVRDYIRNHRYYGDKITADELV